MRRTDKLLKVISAVAFIAVLVYIGYYLYASWTDPLKTASAILYTVQQNAEGEGYVVRSEKLLDGVGSYIDVVAEDGEKLAAGGCYAVSYQDPDALERDADIHDIQLQIEQLQGMMSANEAMNMKAESVKTLSKAVKSKDFESLESAVLDVKTYVFQGAVFKGNEELEKKIQELRAQQAAIEARVSSETEKICTDTPGVFSTFVDGFENVSGNYLKGITPTKLDALFDRQEIVPNDNRGKLVLSQVWYYAANIDEESAAKLHVGDSIKLDFYELMNDTIEMTVESISESEDGKCAVVLSGSKYVNNVLAVRQTPVRILFSSYTGIKIPKEAVHLYEDKTPFIYVIAGQQAEAVEISILDDMGDFYVVDKTISGSVREGDEIIISAKDLQEGKVVR